MSTPPSHIISCLYLLLMAICCSFCTDHTDAKKLRVFHYNQHNNLTSLDPAYAKSQNNVWAVNHIFSTLVNLDDQLNIIPAIAKKWEISEDGLAYSFVLRNDVSYHSDVCFGSEMTRLVKAQDFVYSFERLMDTVLNAPGSWIFKGKVRPNQAFEALNDSTLVIHLQQAFSPFLSLLTMQYCSVIPKEAVDYYKQDFFKHPIGTGPFKFKRWIENKGLFLLRFEDYYEWKDSTYQSNLDGVRTSFIGERSLAFLELINRRLDYFSGLESSYIYTALEADGTLKSKYNNSRFQKAPFLNFEYLGINSNAPGAHPLLGDVNFRKALNYGIDRNLMLASLRNNVGIPANAGVITKGLPAYDTAKVKGYYYDKNKAIKLIADMDPAKVSEVLTIYTSKDYLDLTAYITRQWEDLGLRTKIEVMESASLRNAMRTGDIPLFRASWIADYPDGESFLSMFFSANGAPPNYTRFNHREFDRLYIKSMGITDVEQKIAIYQQMDKILIEEAPVVFLFYDEISSFSDQRISGLSTNALNLLQVKGINKSLD